MTREKALLEARRKQDTGEFDRAVTGLKPDDLNWDELTLECGHTMLWHRTGIIPAPQRQECSKCANAWIEGNTTS